MKETYASAEEGLRKELTDVSLFPYSAVSARLESLMPGEANDLLARIAEDADRERPTFWSYIFAFLWLILTFDAFIDLPSGRKTKKRMAGTRAALYLAQRSDLRAIVPLARAWDPRLLSKSEYQKQIEQSLIQLLSSTNNVTNTYVPTAALAELAERVWHGKRLSHDLTSSHCDLLLALVRQLNGRGSEAQVALEMLQEGGNGPHRTRVRTAAQATRIQTI